MDLKEIFDRSKDYCKIDYEAFYSTDIEILKDISKIYNKDYFISIFLEKGKFVFEIDCSEYSIIAPAILFIPFETILRIVYYDKNASLVFLMSSVSLRKNLLDNFINEISIEQKIKITPFYILDNEGETFLVQHIENIKRIFSYTSNPHRLKALKYLLTSAFYQFFYKLYSLDNLNDYGISSKFLELLEMKFVEWRNSKLYAKHLGVSTGHLDFVLRRKMKKTAKTLIDERIVKEAKHLLKESSSSIEQIAKDLGFSSIDVFSRFFKRVAGVSPSKLRE